jgi:putative tryptophan/tyrosine transport system substrate-binding protein
MVRSWSAYDSNHGSARLARPAGNVTGLTTISGDLVAKRMELIKEFFPAFTKVAILVRESSPTAPHYIQQSRFAAEVTGADPVALGFVPSLNRPGGNITGVASLADEVGPKRLEAVRELLPTTSEIALLINPTNPTAETISKDVQASARVLGQVVHILNASTEREIDTAFERIAELRAGALLVTNDAFFNNRPGQFIALAARHALPAIYPWREFVLAGGLMSYGTSIAYLYREVGIYVGRVLKGEKPADLPVQQATKVELIINLKTAKALGLTFPITLLGRADEVIE